MDIPASTLPSLEFYAMAAEPDPAMPVSAMGSIVVAAPVDRVWRVVTDVANWPAIRADIHDILTEGDAATGSHFSWHTAGTRLRSCFARVEPPHLLTYSTTTSGLDMVHVYRFEALASNVTRLTIAESMNAPMAAPHIGNAELAAGIQSWLAGIKAVSERN